MHRFIKKLHSEIKLSKGTNKFKQKQEITMTGLRAKASAQDIAKTWFREYADAIDQLHEMYSKDKNRFKHIFVNSDWLSKAQSSMRSRSQSKEVRQYQDELSEAQAVEHVSVQGDLQSSERAEIYRGM
jgi:hypothetical protein